MLFDPLVEDVKVEIQAKYWNLYINLEFQMKLRFLDKFIIKIKFIEMGLYMAPDIV